MDKSSYFIYMILMFFILISQYGCRQNEVHLFNGYKFVRYQSYNSRLQDKNGVFVIKDSKFSGTFWAKYPFIYGDYISKRRLKYFILNTETEKLFCFNDFGAFDAMSEKKNLTNFSEQSCREKDLLNRTERRERFKNIINNVEGK